MGKSRTATQYTGWTRLLQDVLAKKYCFIGAKHELLDQFRD